MMDGFIAARFRCRAFIAPRRFAPSNVGAPPRTPGTPPHPRHHGRFIAARSLPHVSIAPRRFAPSNVGAPPRTPGTPPHPRHDGRVHRGAFIAARLHCDAPARTVNVGAPLVTPGTPPHPRHDGRFIAAHFRCAERSFRCGTTRHVSVAAVHVVPCRAPGVMNGAPTVHRAALRCGGADKHGGPPR